MKVRGGYLQESSLTSDINSTFKGLPGGPVIKNLLSNAEGVGSIPGWGTRIPHAMWCSQKTFFLKVALSRVPKTTVTFDKSLKGFVEFTESYHPHS